MAPLWNKQLFVFIWRCFRNMQKLNYPVFLKKNKKSENIVWHAPCASIFSWTSWRVPLPLRLGDHDKIQQFIMSLLQSSDTPKRFKKEPSKMKKQRQRYLDFRSVLSPIKQLYGVGKQVHLSYDLYCSVSSSSNLTGWITLEHLQKCQLLTLHTQLEVY